MQPARHCRTSRASEREASSGDTQTPGARSRLGGGAPSGHSRPATTFGVRQGGGALGYSAVQHCLREPREGKLWYAAVGACAQLPHVWYACTVGCEDRRREVTSGRRAGAIQTCKRTWLLGSRRRSGIWGTRLWLGYGCARCNSVVQTAARGASARLQGRDESYEKPETPRDAATQCTRVDCRVSWT